MPPSIDGSTVVTGGVNDVTTYTSAAGAKPSAGANRCGIIVAGGYMYGTSGFARGSGTWGGSAVTRVDEYEGNTDDDFWVGIYRYLAPPTSGSQIAMTFSGNLTGGVVIASYQDVNQTTPCGTPTRARGSSGTASVTHTATTDDLVIDALMYSNNPTVGAGQTFVGEATNGSDKYAGHSYEAGASSVTMSWTATTNPWVIIAVSLLPAAAGGDQPTEVRSTPEFGVPMGTVNGIPNVNGFDNGGLLSIQSEIEKWRQAGRKRKRNYWFQDNGIYRKAA